MIVEKCESKDKNYSWVVEEYKSDDKYMAWLTNIHVLLKSISDGNKYMCSIKIKYKRAT